MNGTAHVCFSGTGVCCPKKKVLAEELDSRYGVPKGTCVKLTGVEERYIVTDETASEMAATAAEDALTAAGIGLTDVDAIVSVSAVTEQPIPCQAALVQRQLGGGSSGRYRAGYQCDLLGVRDRPRSSFGCDRSGTLLTRADCQ